jgi:hypothetical protein
MLTATEGLDTHSQTSHARKRSVADTFIRRASVICQSASDVGCCPQTDGRHVGNPAWSWSRNIPVQDATHIVWDTGFASRRDHIQITFFKFSQCTKCYSVPVLGNLLHE